MSMDLLVQLLVMSLIVLPAGVCAAPLTARMAPVASAAMTGPGDDGDGAPHNLPF
jgi:hypothetical protein